MSSSDQEPRRRRAAGTGPLVHAGAATAQTKSLRRYRKRQEQRFAHKASALRQYKKAMKKEGYEAGRGAGRKRYRDGQEDEESDGEGKRYGVAADNGRHGEASSDDEEGGSSGNRDTTLKNKKRRKKIDPMANIRRKAEEKREERSRIAEEREQKKKTDAAKERQRKKNFRTKQKRTRKGQPIMGDMIKGMLEKLQKDAGH